MKKKKQYGGNSREQKVERKTKGVGKETEEEANNEGKEELGRKEEIEIRILNKTD